MINAFSHLLSGLTHTVLAIVICIGISIFYFVALSLVVWITFVIFHPVSQSFRFVSLQTFLMLLLFVGGTILILLSLKRSLATVEKKFKVIYWLILSIYFALIASLFSMTSQFNTGQYGTDPSNVLTKAGFPIKFGFYSPKTFIYFNWISFYTNLLIWFCFIVEIQILHFLLKNRKLVIISPRLYKYHFLTALIIPFLTYPLVKIGRSPDNLRFSLYQLTKNYREQPQQRYFPSEEERALASAQKAYDAKDFEMAIRFTEKVILTYRYQAAGTQISFHESILTQALWIKGKSYLALGKTSEAEREFNRLLNEFPFSNVAELSRQELQRNKQEKKITPN